MSASFQNTAADFTVYTLPYGYFTYDFRLDDVVELLTTDCAELRTLWPLDRNASREEIINWLATNDRDGCYRDEDCEAEGLCPNDRDAALWQVFAVYDEEAIAAIFTLILQSLGPFPEDADIADCVIAQQMGPLMAYAVEIYSNLTGCRVKVADVYESQYSRAQYYWAKYPYLKNWAKYY